MKRLICIVICGLSGIAFARGPHNGHHYSHHHHSSYHSRGWWGPGGRNFLPGFVGGLVGGAVISGNYSPTYVVPSTTVITPTPTIVGQPYRTKIWVEGRWVNPTLPDGTTIRVWQPGHWEIND